MKKEIITLGIVGVDSGQLLICDPCYLDSEYVQREFKSSHEIYRHKDGKLWQFAFGNPTEVANETINPFTGSYEDIIPEYGKKPNQLIEEGEFESSGIDTMAYIPNGEFSYAGIAKATLGNGIGGQLNYMMGHPGVGVAFSSGFGDGSYEVKAEIIHSKTWGKRVSKVWVELITDEEIEELESE
jgi:hypothetical protein